ncbi:MAG: hypothetical protein AB7N71_00440 [Phycisphaerae bacterium]
MKARRGCTVRPAFSWMDIFVAIALLALLISILLPSLSRARELAKRNVCAANIRGVAQSMHLYANDNREWFPHHYFEANTRADHHDAQAPTFDHGVRWVGMMGSSDALRISQETSPTLSPKASHSSRSLFLLIISNYTTVHGFICPSSGDVPDDLRNYGPDSARGEMSAAQPGVDRFDFRGYDKLSFGMRLPYSGAAFNTRLDPRTPVAADKSPFYTRGGPGLAGSETMHDARSSLEPNAAWRTMSVEQILKLRERALRSYNSVNHASEGQNVAFADGHVEFALTPFAGLGRDNIYTLQDGGETLNAMVGMVPSETATLGPNLPQDSFMVP